MHMVTKLQKWLSLQRPLQLLYILFSQSISSERYPVWQQRRDVKTSQLCSRFKILSLFRQVTSFNTDGHHKLKATAIWASMAQPEGRHVATGGLWVMDAAEAGSVTVIFVCVTYYAAPLSLPKHMSQVCQEQSSVSPSHPWPLGPKCAATTGLRPVKASLHVKEANVRHRIQPSLSDCALHRHITVCAN